MASHKDLVKRAANSPRNKLLRSLASELPTAKTLDEQIQALVAVLPERAKDLVLRRWGYREWPIPTLESLGERNRITRERVRQIVAGHDDLLKELAATDHVPVEIAAGIGSLFAGEEGVTHEELRAALKTSGLVSSEEALRVLPSFAEIGLIPPVYFDSPTGLWFCASRAVELRDPENPWHADVRHMMSRARASVKRTGAVHTARVRSVPGINVERAARVLSPGGSTLVDGYLVPTEQSDSVTARRTRLMLAVTPSLTLDEIRRGLRRVMPRPIRLPVTVIKEILLKLPDFRFGNAKITLTNQIPMEEALGKVELDLVNAIVNRGGAVTQHEVIAILVDKGHSPSWLQHFHYAPFVVRPSAGMYAIRGREVTRTLEEPRNVADKRRTKSRVLVHTHWKTSDEVTLRLRLTSQTIRGVVHLPKQVRLALPKESTAWTTVAEGQQIGSVSTGGGMLWDLDSFLAISGAVEGEHVEMRIEFGAKQIDLTRIPREQAIADEARWLAAKVRPTREPRDPKSPAERRIRKRPETLEFASEDGWIRVPYSDVDISRVRYFRVVRPLSHKDQEVLISVFTDFPLAPDMHGVYMALWCKVPVRRGKRSFSSGLVEKHVLERGSELSAAEATELVPSLPKRLFFVRHALQWREYRPPQLELLLEEEPNAQSG